MSDDADVEKILVVINHFQKVLDTLKDIDNVEFVINKLGLEKKQELLKQIDNIANECSLKIYNINEKLNKAYKNAKTSDNSDGDLNDTSSRIEVVNSQTDQGNSTETQESLSNNINNVVHNNTSSENEDPVSDSDVIEGSPLKPQHKKVVDRLLGSKSVSEEIQPNKSNIIDDDNKNSNSEENHVQEETAPEALKSNEVLVTSHRDNVEVQNNTANTDNDVNEEENKRPVIKLVDISKLLAPSKTPLDVISPKPKKSVTFDSSVIILSSSDEETPKKHPKEKDQSPLKSAMRKISSQNEVDSDSDSKENKSISSKKRKSRSHKEEGRSLRRRKNNEESDSSPDERNKHKERYEFRASKSKQSKHKALFDKIRSHHRQVKDVINIDNSSDEETNIRSPVKKRKRTKNSSSSSDHSADSDQESLKGKSIQNTKKTKLDTTELDFKRKLSIKLPSYTCQELIDRYKNDLSKTEKNGIKLTLKLNRNYQKDKVSESSDSEVENKKSKKKKHKNRSKKSTSSDEDTETINLKSKNNKTKNSEYSDSENDIKKDKKEKKSKKSVTKYSDNDDNTEENEGINKTKDDSKNKTKNGGEKIKDKNKINKKSRKNITKDSDNDADSTDEGNQTKEDSQNKSEESSQKINDKTTTKDSDKGDNTDENKETKTSSDKIIDKHKFGNTSAKNTDVTEKNCESDNTNISEKRDSDSDSDKNTDNEGNADKNSNNESDTEANVTDKKTEKKSKEVDNNEESENNEMEKNDEHEDNTSKESENENVIDKTKSQSKKNLDNNESVDVEVPHVDTDEVVDHTSDTERIDVQDAQNTSESDKMIDTTPDNEKEKVLNDESEENKDSDETGHSKKNKDDKKNLDCNSTDENDDDDVEVLTKESDDGKKKSKWEDDKSDSDRDFMKFSKKKDKSLVELVSDDEVLPISRKAKKNMKKKAVLSDSESENEEKNESSDGSDKDKKKKKNTKKVSSSDSGSDVDKTNKKRNSSSSSSSSESDQEDEIQKKPTRRRIKRTNDSSSDDDDRSTRKHIRKVIGRDSLSETTKKAEQDEKERKNRMLEKQKKYNQIFQLKADATVDKIVLDFDEKNEKPLLSVNKKLVKQLKPHQVQGIKFMWDACFESLKRAKKDTGSGCILAHCMGLGKTLQVITLTHTLLTQSEKTGVEKVLIVSPVNTVLNWKSEFAKWLPKEEFEVYELVSCKTSSVNQERAYKVREWHENGGVLIIGYNMFRTLSNPDNKTVTKKLRTWFQEGLVDPGPDMVVCDEGHLLKNEKTSLSIAMNKIKTSRRIVLTGTPLQNNLKEYWCMVQFIKPNLLGTYKEYLNRFVNPITNGQYTDSTDHDIVIMRKRSHVLHKLLDGVVQRQDYDVLAPYLPPKYEFVLFLKLTDVQVKLYEHYMQNLARKNQGLARTSFLFNDFQALQRICTHPRVLMEKSAEDKEKKMMESDSEGSLRDFIDDSEDEAKSTSESETSSSNSDSDGSQRAKKKKKGSSKSTLVKKRVTRAQAAQNRENGDSESDVESVGPKEWWQEYIDGDELDNLDHSSKMFLLFQILKECEEIGDKILVFSQSLYTLNCIEYFLQRIDEATQNGETDKIGGHSGSWAIGLDYFRLDGSSSCDNRATWCDAFNNPENTRARLFLISTKAGGLGINLVAANRVIIFDVSWNPSHDIQSIYRVYRFGQTKPCYIYRFVTYGAMEMKIYERQVTKQAISKRVIDEQQIDRHYSQNDIQELYKTDLEPTDRPIPLVPTDVLLGEMLQKYENTIFKYHEHQSLLENKQDEELNEEERKSAWDEFENEKELRKTQLNNFGMMGAGAAAGAAFLNNIANITPELVKIALGNIMKKDHPIWSDVQISGVVSALYQQLQVQVSEHNFTMWNRVQQELRLMQSIQAQRMREQYMQEWQMRQMLQKQQMDNQRLGNMGIGPEELRMIQMAAAAQRAGGGAGTSADVIELND
ncbi:transcriptional regulator ATRX homolog isoform X1 [Sitophilus oryzae]|uniref:Transcriptional regulator ATRX homolog isoform X1 n=1 Tax=Sitophilus oryzae TaxID=7048 RepID=A0A6J2X1Y6_SITOR|nr:transcriptional regulator ATRX homolog isoform X1 [Sitophilus oryzae]